MFVAVSGPAAAPEIGEEFKHLPLASGQNCLGTFVPFPETRQEINIP